MVACHPAISGYKRAEREAIEVHKYFLGIDRGYDPTYEQAVESWEEHHACSWRGRKMRRDAEDQLREIEYHRQQLARDLGRTVDFTEAARDWVYTFGETWRAQREAHDTASV